jgi:hypothetical protein
LSAGAARNGAVKAMPGRTLPEPPDPESGSLRDKAHRNESGSRPVAGTAKTLKAAPTERGVMAEGAAASTAPNGFLQTR